MSRKRLFAIPIATIGLYLGIGGPDVVTPNRASPFTWIFKPASYGLQMDVTRRCRRTAGRW
jgi:hypothetical protein